MIRLEGKIWHEDNYWLVEIRELDLMTQAETFFGIEEMVEDFIDCLVDCIEDSKYKFRYQIVSFMPRDESNGKIHLYIEPEDSYQLALLMVERLKYGKNAQQPNG